MNPLHNFKTNSNNKQKPESKKADPKNVGNQTTLSAKAPPDFIRKQEEENEKKLQAQLDRLKQKEDYINKVLGGGGNNEPKRT